MLPFWTPNPVHSPAAKCLVLERLRTSERQYIIRVVLRILVVDEHGGQDAPAPAVAQKQKNTL